MLSKRQIAARVTKLQEMDEAAHAAYESAEKDWFQDEWGRVIPSRKRTHDRKRAKADRLLQRFDKAANELKGKLNAAGLCADPEDGLTVEESGHEMFELCGFELYLVGNGWC